jgi:hypothetical protein
MVSSVTTSTVACATNTRSNGLGGEPGKTALQEGLRLLITLALRPAPDHR